MTPGEKLLALTLEYRYATEAPAILAGVGEDYRGRSTQEIGAEYETVLREFLTA